MFFAKENKKDYNKKNTQWFKISSVSFLFLNYHKSKLSLLFIIKFYRNLFVKNPCYWHRILLKKRNTKKILTQHFNLTIINSFHYIHQSNIHKKTLPLQIMFTVILSFFSKTQNHHLLYFHLTQKKISMKNLLFLKIFSSINLLKM